MAAAPTSIVPGVALGVLGKLGMQRRHARHSNNDYVALGASIHEVLSIVKDDRQQYPAIELHYSQTEPLATPVVVNLPQNGLRLQFDGADQRLRLIEVTDFKKIRLAYRGSELMKTSDDGPAFKRIYSMSLFGPSFPGEYLPPKNKSPTGTYVLSWPGVAFNFPLQHSAWSKDKDHVSLLGSHVASPATHMVIFDGKSWLEARRDLFVKPPAGPRLSALTSRAKDSLPAELEEARVLGDGQIELLRSQAQPFLITLNSTTPQGLITELGPPDAVHRREERASTPDTGGVHRRTGSTSHPVSNGRPHPGSQPSSYSSTGTDTFDADFDSGGDAEEDPSDRASREKFWCYFSHGLDILIGPPTDTTTVPTIETISAQRTPLATSPHLVVLKVVIHGNVPGSYAFNRHRRLRWSVTLPTTTAHQQQPQQILHSEQNFDHDIKPALLSAFTTTDTWANGTSEMGKGKVVNRTWGGSGNSPIGDSTFLLEDAEQEVLVGEGGGSEQWLGNTKLFAFPGCVFEVLEGGAVGGLTVY